MIVVVRVRKAQLGGVPRMGYVRTQLALISQRRVVHDWYTPVPSKVT